jgi:hypothetical protein
MAQTTRQTNLLVNQDWTKVYQSFTNADFTSYDFETLRNSMINYLKTYYPESFNDFLESSEYLALIDMVAFLGQSLSFRTDLNARENFLDTAQRRDSILKLARMLSYNPTRTTSASGLLKFDSIATTENIFDSNGINLSNTTINWNDLTNTNWLEQFTTILNATLNIGQSIGKPGNSQIINGIQTDEYSISLNTNVLPVAPFTVPIQTAPVKFEAVSATTAGQSYIYENTPVAVNKFNILYRNDNNGNGSNNTGFFVYFKQGSLQATNFTIQNAIPNNVVPINSNNINNTDSWLYGLNVNGGIQTAWEAVPALAGINVIYNQLSNKNLYQISTRNNDQVNLIFGDGSFANVPQGSFRYYYRTGNGLAYTITPDDLASVTIAFQYISATGSAETLTVIASLKYTVTNATATQSLASIKTYAPQQYYTQNRMITGEDYNIFPLTTFTSIQKVKAVNRTSSGVSPYLDSLDPTGSFSSTNIFCDDGTISSNTSVGSSTFSFLTTNDIYTAIYNDIIPIVQSTEMRNYYYGNVAFTRYNSPFANVTFIQTGNTTSSSWGNLTFNGVGNAQVVSTAAKNTGLFANLQYVDVGSSLLFTCSGKSSYASVTNVANGNATVYFGSVVPNAAVLTGTVNGTTAGHQSIIPPFKNDFSTTLINTIASQISAKVNFGLTFDQANQIWVNISPANIGTSTNWLLKFVYNAGLYNIQYKKLTYTFSSAGETKFYYDPSVKVYDSVLGTTINDTINILKINPYYSTSVPIGTDSPWNIYNVITAADGYVDSSHVLIKSPETQMTGVPDNPDLYATVANTQPTRSSLYFQYKHNSPSRNRIDPTPINIVDLYILTADYATSYTNWLRDTTGTLTEPASPTSSSLEIAYSTLDKYKTVSDSLIYNSAKFKPLFGAKADHSLQARFQVVMNPAASLTPNEVKTQVINAINAYFDINNWSFGDTFYFSELAAYLHTTLVPNIASVLIVPADDTLVFGNYFQINAEPWEIITSAATVNDIDIISAVTAAQLNLGNNLIGTY